MFADVLGSLERFYLVVTFLEQLASIRNTLQCGSSTREEYSIVVNSNPRQDVRERSPREQSQINIKEKSNEKKYRYKKS
jgi:hypothetical protein